MTISMTLIIISVFLFSLWFKRSEHITVNDQERAHAVHKKISWSVSLKFAFFMTMVITLQLMLLKILLLP